MQERGKKGETRNPDHKFMSQTDGKHIRGLSKIFFFSLFDFLPEMWRKQCVRTAMARPDAMDVVRSTDETEAPIPAPAAAPHTMNT
jgi:hypothetical protein